MGELSSIDAFLELRDESGKPAVEGECLDKVFGDPKRRAMSLISFELESQVDLAPRDATRKPKSSPVGTGMGPASLSGNGSSAKTSDDTGLDDLLGDDDQDYFTFTITKDIDNATPQLFKAYCENWTAVNSPNTTKKNAGLFASAKVTIRKAGGGKPVEYLIFEFKEVWIRSWELSNKDGDELPEEEVEFAFNIGGFRYYPQTAAGATGRRMESGQFDFRASTGQED